VPADLGIWLPAHEYVPAADPYAWLPAHEYVPANIGDRVPGHEYVRAGLWGRLSTHEYLHAGDIGVWVPIHKYMPADLGIWVPIHKYVSASDAYAGLPEHKYVPAQYPYGGVPGDEYLPSTGAGICSDVRTGLPQHQYVPTSDVGIGLPQHQYLPAANPLDRVPGYHYMPTSDVGIWLPQNLYLPTAHDTFLALSTYTVTFPLDVSHHYAATLPYDHRSHQYYDHRSHQYIGLSGPAGRRRGPTRAGPGRHGGCGGLRGERASPATKDDPTVANLPVYNYKPAVPDFRDSLHTYSGVAVPYKVQLPIRSPHLPVVAGVPHAALPHDQPDMPADPHLPFGS
jgi:hypothetical protein